MEKLRLMSHNVWDMVENAPAWEKRGEDCSAEARAPGHVRVYKETLPDVIGWQESTQIMCDRVKEGCAEIGINYTVIFGRFTPIFYRADKLDLVDTDFFTYPEKIDGFEGCFNNMRSKSCNIAVFRTKAEGKLFIFATTHLWWMREDENTRINQPHMYLPGSDTAREMQMAMLIEKVEKYREKYNCPAILVGDFNTDYNSKAVRYTMSKGYHHAHDIATDHTDETMGYHLCFAWGYVNEYMTNGYQAALDHIFITGEKEGAVKRFERYSPEYYFPISDHSAAFIDIEF